MMPEQAPPIMPMETDHDDMLRKQQLAVFEQLNLPQIRQTYDPEELFVEFSRLPVELIDVEAFKKFLPIVPVEIRTAYGNGKI